ncbi:hybrid sensor histidine kinase/response regulator transcription factor [Chryseobacterium timonianum]|uniref:hybrid sensor histidine kinase/response regulator transcription factor n=1 Tax=Chryseobacterium timonianum TaxID=1805473 RepID=UPI001F4AE200|nr:ATP-binding protein [Chryseobacterium timonianum]
MVKFRICKSIYIVLFFLVQVFVFAQSQTVILTDQQIEKPIWLQNSHWRFHPGDKIEFASPKFSDESWQIISNTNFGIDKYSRAPMPKGWTGIGWFRIKVKKSEANLTDTWAMSINHDGASEVYLDGKKIMAIGKVGNSKENMVASRQPYLSIPLAITDTLPHLIAIRYSNYDAAFPNFYGFQASLQDFQTMNAKQKADKFVMDQLLMSVAAACILILLHLLIFIFYPKLKINLYYILFVACVAIGLYARYQTFVTTSPTGQVFYTKVFMGFVTLHFTFGFLLLYYAAFGKIPLKRTLLMLLASVPVAIYLLLNWYESWYDSKIMWFQIWYQNIFVLIFFADAIIFLLKAIKNGNKKLWLLLVGMFIFIVMGVIAGSNQFGWFTVQQVMIFFGWGNLLMPILFSIYMAIDIANTNRNLAFQLVENKKLSEENLEKEQEKIRLISEQADHLEKTVFERTAQVRDQAEKLQEMDAAKSRFFINLTHEFKTPLTLIINPAKELLQNPAKDTAKQYAQYILKNSERLLQLINQLLDLSRLESGQMKVDYQNIDIVKWLELHVKQFGSLAEHHHLELKFETGQQELWVQTDLDKLEKIVQNLVSNAIKFSEKNGSVNVILQKLNENYFEIKVIDKGIGIKKEKLPYIFDRFYQVDASDSRDREGAGVGLALVKELVELLNGSIEVNSEENMGSAFTVSLPYLSADKNKGAAVTSPLTEIYNNDNNFELFEDELLNENKETILIAEDNEQLREFIEITLKNNYQVLSASNGAEGIQKAQDTVPDLVITDLMMPKKNGYELCDTLKNDERTSHIPIVMLTAKTDQDSKIYGIKSGADAYLSKPFDKTELIAIIENLITTRQKLRLKFSQNNGWLNEISELPSIEQSFLSKIKDIINDRIDDVQLSAESLGSEVGLSRTQLHRKLKALINQSPGELLRTIRMQKAHELLEKKTGSIAEVGFMVGYGNPANFSTSFAKHFGYPPSAVNKD